MYLSNLEMCIRDRNRVARVGGASSGGAGDGLWCWNLSATSSYSGWDCGARVLKYQ